MMKTRKSVIILTCLALVSLYLYVYNPDRPITLTLGFYCDSPWDVPYALPYKVIDDAIALFEDSHPNVTIKYESGFSKEDYMAHLSSQILEEKQPDVYMIPDEEFNLLASTGALEPLNQYLEHDYTLQKQFFECSFNAGTHYQYQMALPFESNPTLMCMNKDLIESHHLKVPTSSWNLTDFYNICQTISTSNNDVYGSTNYSWIDVIDAYNISLFNKQGTAVYINTPEMRSALSYTAKLFNLYHSHNVSSDDFDEGNVAFKPMTLAEYRMYRPFPYRVAKYSSFNWNCIEMPNERSASPNTPVATSLFAMSSRSKHKELSWEFLKLLCANEDIQQELMETSSGVSVLKSVVTSERTKDIMNESDITEDALSPEVLVTIMEHGMTIPQFKSYRQVINYIDHLIEQSLANNTIEMDLPDIQKKTTDYLNHLLMNQ